MKFASVEPQALQHPNWYVTTFSLSPLYDELCLYITIFLVPLMSETLTSLDDLNGLLIASNPSRILLALLCLDIWLTTTFLQTISFLPDAKTLFLHDLGTGVAQS